MEVAENFLGPEVDAAFSGIAVGEFDDGDALRPEKKQQRDDPQPDGDAAVGGDGGDDVEIEDGDDEQQHQIAAPEGADQVRLVGGLWVVDKTFSCGLGSAPASGGQCDGIRPRSSGEDCSMRGGRDAPAPHDL